MIKLLDLLGNTSTTHETIFFIVLLESGSLVAIILCLVADELGLGSTYALVRCITVRLYLEVCWLLLTKLLLLLLDHTRAGDISFSSLYRSC